MLPNTMTINYSSTDHALTKRKEQNGITQYTGSYTSGGLQRDLTLEIMHTRNPFEPSSSKKDSSLLRLTVVRYDANGDYDGTYRTWTVVEGPTASLASFFSYIQGLNSAIFNDASFETEFVGGSY